MDKPNTLSKKQTEEIIKNFLYFSIFIFPVSIGLQLIPIKFLKVERVIRIVFMLAAYFIPLGINLLWRNKKFHGPLVLYSICAGIILLSYSMSDFHKLQGDSIIIGLTLYFFGGAVFILTQIPSLVRSVYAIVGSDKNNWLFYLASMIISIPAFFGLELIIRTLL